VSRDQSVLLAQWPVTVLMQRRIHGQRWRQEQWSALAVLPAGYAHADIELDKPTPDCLQYTVPGLLLELHTDETDGYFENWAAPWPRVFVRWQMQDGRAMPVQVSVSYAEGARMLDGGDGADGVPMPPAVHDWLGACLALHHRPQRGGPHGPRHDGPRRQGPQAA